MRGGKNPAVKVALNRFNSLETQCPLMELHTRWSGVLQISSDRDDPRMLLS